jgi:hypothetical protein
MLALQCRVLWLQKVLNVPLKRCSVRSLSQSVIRLDHAKESGVTSIEGELELKKDVNDTSDKGMYTERKGSLQR